MEHPEHEEHARKTLARVHALNNKINELERHPNNMWTYKKAVKEARQEYTDFYRSEIIESYNPIIQKLYAE
jgi:hypothetical protein